MRLDELEIRNIRILSSVDCTPGDQLNIFVGANGSGKTSILEGIHVLGSGRSFRTHRLSELIARDHSWLRVRGVIRGEDGASESVGVEKGAEGLRIHLAGDEVRSASELARRLPLVVITPDSQRFLLVKPDELEQSATHLNLVLNWTEELKRLVPTDN